MTRVDLHCHSTASAVAKLGVQQALGLPECATPPDEVYALARRRGMDFVTITDHDTIAGALAIAELPGTFVSEELTASFRGEPQQVHVLCLGITPDDHARLQERRGDVETHGGIGIGGTDDHAGIDIGRGILCPAEPAALGDGWRTALAGAGARAGGGGMSAERTIAVALHDVEPATFERCALIRDWLARPRRRPRHAARRPRRRPPPVLPAAPRPRRLAARLPRPRRHGRPARLPARAGAAPGVLRPVRGGDAREPGGRPQAARARGRRPARLRRARATPTRRCCGASWPPATTGGRP